MALKKYEKTGGSNVFADISGKNGCIVVRGQDGAPNEEFEQVDGVVTNLDIKTHTMPDQNVITNLRIKLEDGNGPPTIASVALGSFFSAKIVGLLNAADLTKPIALRVGMTKMGDKIGDRTAEKDSVWVTVRQDGNRLTPVYSEGKDKLPDAPKVSVGGGKTVTNMEFVDAEVATVVKGLFAKMDAIHDAAKVKGDDEGITLAEAQAAAGAADSQRAAMAPRG